VAIGLQQLIDVAVVIGNRAPDPDRTAMTAAADQVEHGIAVALGSGLFQNRFDKDPQLKHDRQGPQQASAASLQEHGEPANGERLPQPGQARGRMFAD